MRSPRWPASSVSGCRPAASSEERIIAALSHPARPPAPAAAAAALGEARELRNALGRFATGVCVVTTADADGRRIGLTVNSFTSVSLDPPLVAWCLRNDAPSRPVFAGSGYFAVHVLGSAQRHIAQHFARPHADKFAALAGPVASGVGNVPVLPDALALFECRTEAMHDCGDHVLVIGRVEQFRYGCGSPLLFHAGRLLPEEGTLQPGEPQR